MTTNQSPVETSRQLLRHAIATVAYRGGKALRGAPESFAEFELADKCRTPARTLAHIGDLYDWALALCHGKYDWHDSTPLPWKQEVERFFAALKKFGRLPGGRIAFGILSGEIVSRPGGRFTHAHRPDRHDAAGSGMADSWRELFSCRNGDWQSGRSAGGASEGICVNCQNCHDLVVFASIKRDSKMP